MAGSDAPGTAQPQAPRHRQHGRERQRGPQQRDRVVRLGDGPPPERGRPGDRERRRRPPFAGHQSDAARGRHRALDHVLVARPVARPAPGHVLRVGGDAEVEAGIGLIALPQRVAQSAAGGGERQRAHHGRDAGRRPCARAPAGSGRGPVAAAVEQEQRAAQQHGQQRQRARRASDGHVGADQRVEHEAQQCQSQRGSDERRLRAPPRAAHQMKRRTEADQEQAGDGARQQRGHPHSASGPSELPGR